MKTIASMAAAVGLILSAVQSASAAENPCAQLSVTSGWTYSINIKNICSAPLSLQGATVSFKTNATLNSSSLWGFNGLSYPTDASLKSVGQNSYAYSYQFGSWAQASQTQLTQNQTTTLSFSPSTDPATFSVSGLSFSNNATPVVNTGSITFTGNITVPSSTVVNVTGLSHQYQITGGFSNNQYVLNNVAFDQYSLSAYYVDNGSQKTIPLSPTSFTLGSTHTAQAVNMTIPVVPTVGMNLTLPNKPNDTLPAQVGVTVTDVSKSTSQTANISWGQTLTVSLTQGDSYALTANDVTGNYLLYHFTFTPSQFVAGSQGQNVQMSYSTTALPTGKIAMNVTGLPPSKTATVTFTDQNQKAYSFTLGNGSTSNTLPLGTYSVVAGALSVSGTNYTASVTPSQALVSQNATATLTVTYAPTVGVKFSPYFDTSVNADWNLNQPGDLSAYINATGLKDFHAAFITDAGRCNPAWAGVASLSAVGGSQAWGYNWFSNMRSKNIGYTIAFGGSNGVDISQNCSPSALVAAYQNVLTTYQPNGLDFDIEGALVANPTAYQKIVNALVTIQAQNPNLPISFTLPVMPEGLTPDGLNVIKAAQAAGLQFRVNIMAMDYGPSYNLDMGQYAIQAVNAVEGQLATIYGSSKTSYELYNMIGVTPMIGVNDVAGEFFTLQDTTLLTQYAAQKGLAMVSMWSLNRDVSCTSNWASPTCSGAHNGVTAQKATGDFAKAFLGK